MILVAGLGNPGIQYARTRHNVGFRVIDSLASDLETAVSKTLFKSLTGEAMLGGEKIILAKPQTFMNLSGISVAALIKWYKLIPAELVVVYDDMDLPVGRIRIRESGGHGGHRGIMSIMEHMGTGNFIRVRVGIGRPDNCFYDPADWVLGRFSPDEENIVAKSVTSAASAIKMIAGSGSGAAMNKFNRKV